MILYYETNLPCTCASSLKADMVGRISAYTLAELAFIYAPIKQPQIPVIAHSLVCFQLGDFQ